MVEHIEQMVQSGFRPSNLPPKSPMERERHQAHVEAILSAAARSPLIVRDAEKRAVDALWQTELMTGPELELTEQMKRLWAEYGLPSQFVRSVLWPWISASTCPLMSAILNPIKYSSSLIELDVKRTLPFLGYGNDQVKTSRCIGLLENFSSRHPHVGYTQGMSYVAVRLMMELDWSEKKALVCLERILVGSPTVACMYSLDLDRINASVGYVLDSLAWDNISSLWLFFQNLSFRPIEWFFLEWGLTVFVKNFPLKISGFVLDLLFLEGDVVLYKATIAALSLIAPVLMALDDVEHVRATVGRVGDHITDSETFIKAYHEVSVREPLTRIIHSNILFT
jgi:hypothetical protein